CYDVSSIDVTLVDEQGGNTALGAAPFAYDITINGGSVISCTGVEFDDSFDVLDYLPLDQYNQPVPGDYEIQVESFVDANGCALSEGALNFYNFTITINPQPDVFFEVDGDPLSPA